MQPYAVRVPQDQLSEIERWGGMALYRISQWFYMRSARNPGSFFYMSALNIKGRTPEERRERHPLNKEEYTYAGFVIFENDYDAYQHWLKEHAPLDACFDWSDEGKGSGDVYWYYTFVNHQRDIANNYGRWKELNASGTRITAEEQRLPGSTIPGYQQGRG